MKSLWLFPPLRSKWKIWVGKILTFSHQWNWSQYASAPVREPIQFKLQCFVLLGVFCLNICVRCLPKVLSGKQMILQPAERYRTSRVFLSAEQGCSCLGKMLCHATPYQCWSDSFPAVGCWDLLMFGLSQSRASFWVHLLLRLGQKCKFCTVAPFCLSSSLCPYSSADQDWTGSVRLLIFFVFKSFFHQKAAGTALLGIDFWHYHKGSGGAVFAGPGDSWAPALQSCTSVSLSCQRGRADVRGEGQHPLRSW